MIKVIKVSEELSNYLERLSREVEGSKDIISFMIENNKNINTDAFKSYKKEFDEVYAEFDLAKQDVQKKFVPTALTDADAEHTSWSLDYATHDLTITYNGKQFTEEQFNKLFD